MLERIPFSTEVAVGPGRRVTAHGETLRLALGRSAGAFVEYRRPVAIVDDRNGTLIRHHITDQIMLARLLAAFAVSIVLIVGRRRRDR